MVPIIYDILLILMLFILYRCGKNIAKTKKLLSPAFIIAIISYTLNEGLRFGRGIDYNLYGLEFESLERGGESNFEVGFLYIAKILIENGIPWQGYVMLMSFIFILATIILLRNFREILPYALPLFVLFSISETENMVRWYLGFSFIMVGLVYLLREKRQSTIFVLFCLLACTFHIALFPLALAFYMLCLFKKPLFSPLWTLALYFAIAFVFQTDFMLPLVGMVNILSGTSERFANYGNQAEYWLTSGYAGRENFSALPNLQELIFYCFLVWLGYKAIREMDKKYIFVYNAFLVGLLFNPLALQIELVKRFNQPFMFFCGIVLACVLKHFFATKAIRINRFIWLFSLLVFVNMGRRILVAPFKTHPDKYLYIWDSKGKSYDAMYDMWIDEMLKNDR